ARDLSVAVALGVQSPRSLDGALLGWVGLEGTIRGGSEAEWGRAREHAPVLLDLESCLCPSSDEGALVFCHAVQDGAKERVGGVRSVTHTVCRGEAGLALG